MHTMTTRALKITVRVCAVISVMAAATAEAQIPTAGSTAAEVAAPARSRVGDLGEINEGALQIRDWRWSDTGTLFRASTSGQNRFGPGPRLMPPPQGRRHVGRGLIARRVVAGVIGGLAGFLGGGLLGAVSARDCEPEYCGLAAVFVGAPIGAAVGAVAGVAMIH
jgi:hypothetical protein